MKKITAIVALLLCFFFPFLAQADEQAGLKLMSEKVKDISENISRGTFEGEDLAAWTKLTIKLKSAASLCVSNNEEALLELQNKLDGLGETVKDEDAAVSRQRQEYQKQKDELNKSLAKCNLYVLTSIEASELINEAEKSYFKQKYLVKSPNIIELVITYLDNPVALLENSGHFFFERSGIREIDVADLVVSIMLIIASIFIGVFVRKKLIRLESKLHWHDDFSENLARALLTTLSHSAPYIIGSAVAALCSIVITLESEEIPFITEFFVGLLVFFISTTVIRLLFSPDPPASQFISFSPGFAESLARRLKVLTILSLVGYMAFYTVFSESIVESNLLLLRNIFSLFFVLNVVWTLQVILKSPRLPKLRYLSMMVIVVILLSLVAEWIGYRNIAFSSRRIILFTFILFIIFLGISKLFNDLFDAVEKGTYAWCRRIRDSLGIEKNERVPGMMWMRLITAVFIWGSFAYLFINAWDYSGGVIENVKSYVINGFEIGDFRIIPSKILWAVFIFSAIIILSSWVRSQLESNWLKMTSMGQGARDASVTITGYAMFMIAILAALSTAGYDFGNLAIIAGALSVGIGFGLQNIVNNFVSGLILLFERPIRKGDWIVVGTTEGVVKEIQIRSTRIETFDRSDVIVPNSELISNQVTNWVLSSSSGRAVIPVGVAYGSDTEKVREVLLSVAQENDDIAKTDFLPEPKVLFRAFGDSSLNFELRAFLHNVDSRLSVISDLNFAIDKAFREAGIEIPFPQRDLHVKSMPESFPREEQSDSEQERSDSNNDNN